MTAELTECRATFIPWEWHTLRFKWTLHDWKDKPSDESVAHALLRYERVARAVL